MSSDFFWYYANAVSMTCSLEMIFSREFHHKTANKTPRRPASTAPFSEQKSKSVVWSWWLFFAEVGESLRVTAHERLGEVLCILKTILKKYPAVNSTDLLTSTGVLISRIKGGRGEISNPYCVHIHYPRCFRIWSNYFVIRYLSAFRLSE